MTSHGRLNYSTVAAVDIESKWVKRIKEVALKRWSAIVVVVLAVCAGVRLAAGMSGRGSLKVNPDGMMPEVVVKAQGPQLVIPMVEVRASRCVALADPSDLLLS
jgi:hypothetical protein